MPSALAYRNVWFPKHRELWLHCLSDVHIAADRHQSKALKARLEAIRKAGDNHRMILHGDWWDFRNKTGKSFRHGAMSPQDESNEIARILKPYADRIDLVLNGNHEWRAEREAGLDPMQNLAALLGLPDAYRRGPTVVKYGYFESKGNHGQCRFHAQVLVHHGFGGGSPGAARNNIERLGNWKQDVDLVVMGHVHQNNISKRVVYSGWPPSLHEQTLIVSGTFVDHEDYAMEKGLTPSWVGAPVIRLYGTAHDSRVKVEASLG